MTKRDFFRVIIKLFGLYWIISTIFSVIPGNIAFALSDFGVEGILWVTGTTIITFLIYYALIMRVDYVIDLLKLDKGFDEETISFEKFNDSNIFKLALILIGGYLVIENIPGFLSHVLFALKEDVTGTQLRVDGNFNWLISALNILVGFLLMTNYKWINKQLTKD